jgi:hypothetical protein
LKLSAWNPGISDQLANNQRLLGFVKTAGVLSDTGASGNAAAMGAFGFLSGEEQAAKRKTLKKQKLPTIHEPRSFCMGLILLEALLALLILLAIVWWTMFSGRDKGELKSHEKHEPAEPETKNPPKE